MVVKKQRPSEFLKNQLAAVHDAVNHPAHYNQGGIECIDALKACMNRDEFLGMLRGNTIKYLWRTRQKNGLEDLKKAGWYLDRLILEMRNE